MANRGRVTALIALAMLNVFTLGSGVVAARLLPARLALWHVARVAHVSPAQIPPPPGPAVPAVPAPAAGRVAAVLSPLLTASALGPHTGALVTDLATGEVLFSRNALSPATPASSAKVATAEAALTVLGPDARFATRVVTGGTGRTITLVGGGDPTLAAGHVPVAGYPRPATLSSLAAAAARWLRAHGRTAVRLSYDTSLFTGPSMAPGWTPQYVATGNVTPITALEVDQGRLTASGAPEDADNPVNFRARSMTPAADAAHSFATFLRASGVRVIGPVSAARARAAASTIASVQSPPVSAVVAQMLRESNNVIAEDLARQVALRTGRPATFAGGAQAVTAVVSGLGVRTGVHLVDGSGLSPQDAFTPQALVGLVTLAGDGQHPGLAPVVSALPVAGFSGTLAAGQSVFGGFGRAALGAVRAKTGNLSRVVSLTGLVTDRQGRVLAFAFMADHLPAGQLMNGARVLDSMATALAGCGCR